MLQAKYELRRLLREHRHGAHGTQEARRDTVQAFVKALDENGFSKAVRQKGFAIKEKHVRRVVGVWRNQDGVGTRTIEKRLSHLRSMARWQGNPGLLRSNAEYLPGRDTDRTRQESKAADVSAVDVEAARTPWAQASLGLQKEFGLRRKEALLVQPERSPADCAKLVLHGAACKGGRPREIEARTEGQRQAIAFAKDVARGGSLVPPGRTYADWRDEYRREAERAGVPNGSTHALRFAYAEGRYAEATKSLSADGGGWQAPVAGGPYRPDMDAADKAVDGQARDLVSAELGHGRRAVVSAYIGGAKAPEPDGEGE